MDSYLMMLYVTFEQESALKFFFIEQGWAFCKPDLSVTTDKLGPTTSVLPVVGEETEVVGGEREPIQKIKVKIPAMKTSTKQKGKRKSIKQTGRSTKQNKRMSGSLGTEPNVTDVIMDMDDVQTIHSGGAIATALNASLTQDVQNINSRSAIDPDLNLNAPFTVQFGDGNEMQIKVENVVEDNDAAVDDSDDNGDDEIDTDIDNSYEGAMENDTDVKSRGKFQDESGAKDNYCVAPKDSKTKYRLQYNRANLQCAFEATQRGMSVYRAARQYNVPESTLRDRTRGNVTMDAKPGQSGIIFNQVEERELVDHIMHMADIGYSYHKFEIQYMGRDFAVSLGKLVKCKESLSNVWFYEFLHRWPDLKREMPSAATPRAKEMTTTHIDDYFKELDTILCNHDLHDHPERVFIIHETEISLENLSCKKAGGKESISSSNVTMIASGNASGICIPPYYVFKRKTWNADLLHGAAIGSNGEVTKDELSNSTIYSNYLTKHFVKYVQLSEQKHEDKILILYDAHRSHIRLTLARWAEKKNVILFVLPPHSSSLAQPFDADIFGPFKTMYKQECRTFLEQNPGTSIKHANIAGLTAKPYIRALQSENLISVFRNFGVHPFNSAIVVQSLNAQAVTYSEQEPDVPLLI